MKNWTTLISFTYPHEAHLVKGKLESEGIEVLLKDELTAQVNNIYSAAIGGVKLIVQDIDYDKAYQILVDTGNIKESKTEPNKFLIRFDDLTSNLPFIGKSLLVVRLLVFVALAIVMLIVPIALLS